MKYNPSELNTNFKDFLKKQKLSESTIKYYISDVRVFLRFIYQTTGEYEIAVESFESYENYLKSGKLPRKTINRKLSSLRIFNAYLLKIGVLQDNLMKKIRNSSRSYRGSKTVVPQTLIIFLAIVLIGGIFLTLNRESIKTISPQESVSTIAIPSSINTNATSIPETLDARQLNQITIESDSLTTLENRVSGVEIIPSGSVEKIIYNPSVSRTRSLIFITPTAPHDANYYVNQSDGSFRIILSKPLKNNFTFNWFVVQQQTTVDRLP